MPLTPLATAHLPFGLPRLGDKLSASMRPIYALFFGLVATLNCFGGGFYASGRVDSAGWAWFPGGAGQAQWEFYDLAWEGQYLSVEIFLQTRGWQVPPPSSLCLALQFSSFSASITKQVKLQRVAEKGEYVSYFGQMILSRRDLDLGSYLVVRLKNCPNNVEIGVHQASLRVLGERSASLASLGGSGMGGPLVTGFSGATDTRAVDNPSPIFSQISAKTVRECAGMEDAPYVSPGRYECELGWPGPGFALDSRDWMRVNLNAGHLLDVQANSPHPIILSIFDPFGREVGRVSGSGLLGITYQAPAPGVYWICVAINQSTPLFTCTLDIAIRR